LFVEIKSIVVQLLLHHSAILFTILHTHMRFGFMQGLCKTILNNTHFPALQKEVCSALHFALQWVQMD